MNPEESLRPQTVAAFRKRLKDTIGTDATVALKPQDPQTIRLASQVEHPRTAVSGSADSRRNMVCTILFLDIVAYSTKSVDEQFAMKSAFNQLIAGKLAHIPDASRVTLDTGDGAAICFMGDPEDVLHATIDILRGLTQSGSMQLRIGIHIGPIRLLTDLNGRDNVIGDGINVAQRVMSFAHTNQIVVSRSYYDVVACLSDNGASRFVHLGEHRDKHDRAHDIYAVVMDGEADAEPVRTVQLNPQDPLPSHIDSSTLTELAKELAHLIGPLAPVLVRKAAGRAKTVEEMRELLSQSISDPAQRQAFLDGTTATSTTQRSGNLNTAKTKTLMTAAHSVASTSTPQPDSSTPSLRPWLSDEISKRLEKHLTTAIGPVARIVMKAEIRKAADLEALCKALAAQIDNPEARANFLKNIKR
jgi:class 3 adenylate cyclase